jgi:hypothetical protein
MINHRSAKPILNSAPSFRLAPSAFVLCLLLVSCGFVPNEGKLVGAWQVDLPHTQKVIYDFRKDHTYFMTIRGHEGTSQGKWNLEGDVLTMTLTSFEAYDMTNALPMVQGLSTQKNVIVRLTGTAMVWRTGLLGGSLKFKHVTSSPPAEGAS